MRKRSNSSDVARLAGVSRTTVSYVLRDSANATISEATRARVMKAAEELSYRSNRLADGLLRGKTQTIGVIVPYLGGDYHGTICQGIQEHCRTVGYRTLITSSLGDAKIAAEESRLLLEHRVDGIVYIDGGESPIQPPSWLDEYAKEGVATCVVEYQMDSVDSVVSDHIHGIGALVDYLCSLGHERIGYLLPPAQGRNVIRCSVFEDVIRKRGLPFDESWLVSVPFEEKPERTGAGAFCGLLGVEGAPTAWIGNTDYSAIAAWRIAYAELGRWPEEIALVGYGGTEIGKGAGVTTVCQFPHEVGRRAARRLFERIENLDLPPTVVVVPTEMIVRGPSPRRDMPEAS